MLDLSERCQRGQFLIGDPRASGQDEFAQLFEARECLEAGARDFLAAIDVEALQMFEGAQFLEVRIRQIGVERVLYGSDAAASPLTYPKAGWSAFRRLPLSEAEFRVIANNIAPYMRDSTPR